MARQFRLASSPLLLGLSMGGRLGGQWGHGPPPIFGSMNFKQKHKIKVCVSSSWWGLGTIPSVPHLTGPLYLLFTLQVNLWYLTYLPPLIWLLAPSPGLSTSATVHKPWETDRERKKTWKPNAPRSNYYKDLINLAQDNLSFPRTNFWIDQN